MSEIHDNWSGNQSRDPHEYMPKFMFCLVLEAVLFATHYLIYLEALQLPSVTYLSEIPPFSMFLDYDSELSLAHIISALFALTSVLIPITIWDTILTGNLPEEWDIFIGSIRGKIKIVLLPLMYLIVILLEISAFSVYLSKIIDDLTDTGFIVDTEGVDRMIELARNNAEYFQILGTIVLILINATIAWITAKTYFSMKSNNDGGL